MDVQPTDAVNPNVEPAEGQQEVSASEMVENFFNAMPRSLVGSKREAATPAESEEEKPAEASQETKEEAASEPAPSPVDLRIKELTEKLGKSQKSYDNLQSTVDGRIHAATKDLREQVAETNKLAQALVLRLANPGQEPDEYRTGYTQEQQPKNQITKEQIQELIQATLAKDPKSAKGAALAELLEFRAERPDANRYDLFTQKVLEKFPELRQSRGLRGSLDALYELGQELELTQLQMAKAMEEAAKAEAQKQLNQNTKTNGKLTKEEADALKQRADALTNEKKVSSTPNVRPKIDKRMPYNKQIDSVVDAWMRKIGA